MIKRASREKPSSGKPRLADRRKRSGAFTNYKPRSAESVKQRAEQTGGRFDSCFKPNVDTWRPKVGENVIRILPASWPGHDHYGFDVWVHPRIGPDNSTYICPRKMQNKTCPVCLAEKEARDAGEEDEAKQLAAKKTVCVWIIDRDGEDDTPALYQMSWTMDKDIASLCHNKRTGKTLLIDHPDDGYDVIIKRTGQGLKTRYTEQIDREPTPVHEDDKVVADIEDFLEENQIPDMLHYYNEEYLEKVLEGTAEPKDEDLDEDNKTTTRTGKRSSRDENEDEDERPVRRSARKPRDEDEDADERPTGRRGSKRSSDSDDDDEDRSSRRTARRGRGRDDDADEGEEEEKERPRGRRRSTRDEDDNGEEGEEAGEEAEDSADEDVDGEVDDEAGGEGEGEEGEDSQVDDDEDKQPRRSSRRTSTRQSQDEDEEEEKPRSTRRSSKPGRVRRAGRG